MEAGLLLKAHWLLQSIHSLSSNVHRWTSCIRGLQSAELSDMAVTQAHSTNINSWSKSASPLCVPVCVCVCVSLSFQMWEGHSWRVTIGTEVALLNQSKHKHACPYSNTLKAGSVRHTGMLNSGWIERLGATMTPKHRQAFTGSGIQLPQAGKRKANTKWEGCTRRKSTRGKKAKGKQFHTSRDTAMAPLTKWQNHVLLQPINITKEI